MPDSKPRKYEVHTPAYGVEENAEENGGNYPESEKHAEEKEYENSNSDGYQNGVHDGAEQAQSCENCGKLHAASFAFFLKIH